MLEKFLNPQSIAIIGASNDPKKLGNVIVKNLIDYKYRGKVYPINHKGEKIYDHKVFTSVVEVPYNVDLVVIVIPAIFVNEALKECGQKKIKAAIIISAGFGEQDQSGKIREQQIITTAKKYKIRILGPNCLGLIIPRLKLNASFAQGLPEPGNVAVISQSGAMAVAITDWALSSDVGFSALVSLGNKSDVNEEELINYFGQDKATNLIVMYLESLATGRSLLRTIKRITKRKPIIILKPGKSKKAKQAVASHTGAMVGSHEAEKAALQSAGAIVASSIEELFVYTEVFEKPYKMSGSNVAIITNAGGPGILATDAIDAAENLNLSVFSELTEKKLKRHLPEAASIENPVDVIGDATAERYKKTIKIILDDKGVDAVIALLTRQYVTDAKKIAKDLITIQKKFPKKPIFVSFIGGSKLELGRKLMSKEDILHFPYPEQAVDAANILRQYEVQKNSSRLFPDVRVLIEKDRSPVLGQQAERMLKPFISDIMPSAMVSSKDQATKKAKQFGYPVVIKVISKKFIHKTDNALVKINIQSDRQLVSVLDEWQKKLKISFAKNEGYLIQPFSPGVIEVMVGVKRDPIIGPYIIVGMGGIFVESFASIVTTPLPLNHQQAKTIINQGLLGRILASERGRKLETNKLAQIIVGMSKLMMTKPKVIECDLNPIIISKNQTQVADIRLIVTK
ncbi:MAG: acetate--CoA ligase family protein [bacterium]|nr:acetate--CoA ligase family protein [bacterium]